MEIKGSVVWAILFGGILAVYGLYYAPFGVNETDGGFLTGLAWQVLSGKVLYQDIIYVRPPLPVWLRACELQLLPEQLAILGERWIFYLKIALYSWMGAAVLTTGKRLWQLATLGFIVSAHCYPAMAWHTVDGILFSVLAVFCCDKMKRANRNKWLKGGYGLLAGTALCCALLCKQSFYPVPLFFLGYLLLGQDRVWPQLTWVFAGFLLSMTLFVNYLYQEHLLAGFLRMINGSASGGQALQHGLLDYLRITPELALPSLGLWTLLAWWFRKKDQPALTLVLWYAWLIALVGSFAAVTCFRQEHTVPFAQSRLMFWLAGIWLLAPIIQNKRSVPSQVISTVFAQPFFLLLGISWCASVSWGYNLPILFAIPWVWAGMEWTRTLEENLRPRKTPGYAGWLFLIVLLLVFRVGFEFVYRDGRRVAMTEHMGAIFPPLSGIYSDPETAALYRDLKQLSERYGPNFKTLPAFPQSNFLTKTSPPFALDWVVNRETNADNQWVIKNFNEKRPILFIQKSFQEKIASDPELELTRRVFQKGKLLEETPCFWVLAYEGI